MRKVNSVIAYKWNNLNQLIQLHSFFPLCQTNMLTTKHVAGFKIQTLTQTIFFKSFFN